MTFGVEFAAGARLTLSSAAVFLSMGRKIRRRTWVEDNGGLAPPLFLQNFCGDVFDETGDLYKPTVEDLQATDWEAVPE